MGFSSFSAPGGQERGGAELGSPLSRASCRQGEGVPSGGHRRQLGMYMHQLVFLVLRFEVLSNFARTLYTHEIAEKTNWCVMFLKQCANMVGDKEQLRDISSIGLKTVINELPLTTTSLAVSVCKVMVGRLSAAIAQQHDISVQLEALDILGDLLSR